MKKFMCMTMACVILLGRLFPVSVFAMDSLDVQVASYHETRATEAYNVTVAAYGLKRANKSFLLEAGDSVRICAKSSPSSAEVLIGLVDAHGYFYYVKVDNGDIDKTIGIVARGEYWLAIENESGCNVTISGFVKY